MYGSLHKFHGLGCLMIMSIFLPGREVLSRCHNEGTEAFSSHVDRRLRYASRERNQLWARSFQGGHGLVNPYGHCIGAHESQLHSSDLEPGLSAAVIHIHPDPRKETAKHGDTVFRSIMVTALFDGAG